MRRLPADARRMIAAMVATPLIIAIPLLPGEVISRALYSVVVGILTAVIGATVEERRELLGWVVATAALAWMVASVAVLALLIYYGAAEIVVLAIWRVLGVTQLAWLCLAWATLALHPTPWLCRCAARGGVSASAVATGWAAWQTLDDLGPARLIPWKLARPLDVIWLWPWVAAVVALYAGWLIFRWRRPRLRPPTLPVQ